MSTRVWSFTSVMIMWAPMSTAATEARSCQSARPASGLVPFTWAAKSTTVVVPPKAAAWEPV